MDVIVGRRCGCGDGCLKLSHYSRETENKLYARSLVLLSEYTYIHIFMYIRARDVRVYIQIEKIRKMCMY